jgi:PAS domain S-box-containing protein
MEQDELPKSPNLSLRQLARQRLNGKIPPLHDLSPADAQTLIHELQVYQVELEMQNEELVASRAQLEQSRNTYSQLYEWAPVAYFTVTHQGLIGRCNQAGSQLLGYPTRFLEAHSLLRFIPQKDRPVFTRFFQALSGAEGKQTCQLRLQPQQGAPRTVLLEGSRRTTVMGTLEYLVAAIDLTEREQARELAQQQRELADRLLENSHEGIALFDPQARLLRGNHPLQREMGWTEDQLVEKSLLEVFPPSFHAALREALGRVWRGERAQVEQVPYPLREGFWEAELVPLRNARQQVTGGLLIASDITLRLLREEEKRQQFRVQQQAVLDAVLLAQQVERKRIAEALHNGVGQILFATKLNLERLLADLAEKADLAGKEAPDFQAAGTRVSKLLEEAIRETRSVSHQLVPQLLENFGLEAALKELIGTVSGPDLRVSFKLTGKPGRLRGSLEGVLYRLAQELLQNIMKHARASEASVLLDCLPTAVRLTVEDNGKGFELARLREATAGLGLRLIREQVDLLEGLLEIDSQPQGGTRIHIELPSPEPALQL